MDTLSTPQIFAPYLVTILTTNNCTARCAHCCMNSAPKRAGTIDVDKAVAAVEEMKRRFPLLVVVFAGGEPTMLKGKLFDMIRRIGALGVNTRMVTNASWAITREKADAMVEKLLAAGLNEINFSTDDYHLDFISFDNIVHAWNASKSKGFRSVVVATSCHPGAKTTPEYIEERLGEKLPYRFDEGGVSIGLPPKSDDGTIYMLSNSPVQMLGRAVIELDETHRCVPETQDILDRPCPFIMRNPAITPENHLVACCGTELSGNRVLDYGAITDDETFNKAFARANNELLTMAIAVLGPKYLMDFVKSKRPDIKFREKYASVCEVCEHVVTRNQVVDVLEDNLGEIAEAVFLHPAYQALNLSVSI